MPSLTRDGASGFGRIQRPTLRPSGPSSRCWYRPGRNTGEDYQRISGWDVALDNCPDMAASRRDYLKEQFSLLTSNPAAYVTAAGRLRARRPQWL